MALRDAQTFQYTTAQYYCYSFNTPLNSWCTVCPMFIFTASRQQNNCMVPAAVDPVFDVILNAPKESLEHTPSDKVGRELMASWLLMSYIGRKLMASLLLMT